MAAGEEDGVLKMYFYGRAEGLVFLEFEINRNLSTVILIVRSELEDLASLIAKYVEDFLRKINLI